MEDSSSSDVGGHGKIQHPLKRSITQRDIRFRGFASMDFSQTLNHIWQLQNYKKKSEFRKFEVWFNFLICGIIVGIGAFIVDWGVEFLVHEKWHLA